MPKIEKGESREKYVARCIPYVMKNEGLDEKAAVGKCEGMFSEHEKKGTNYTDEIQEFTFSFQLQELNKDMQLTKSDAKDFAIRETDDWITIRAVAIIGDRVMNNMFIPYKELKKSVELWNSTFHDYSHLGTSSPDTRPPYTRENIDYIIGFQSNVESNDKTKEISMDVNIYKKAKNYESWKSFMAISKAAGRIPNVSVSVNGKPKIMKAVDAVENIEEFGFKKDDMLLCLSEIMPRALTTCIHGSCDDKKGCGLACGMIEQQENECNDCKECKCGKKSSVGGANMKMTDEDAKKLADLNERIRKLKEEK